MGYQVAELVALAEAGARVAQAALDHARTTVAEFDEAQVLVESLAYAATEARAAHAVATLAARLPAPLQATAAVSVATQVDRLSERLRRLRSRLPATLFAPLAPHEALLQTLLAPEFVQAVGATVVEREGDGRWPLEATLDEIRASVRAFAEREVAPHAEALHHHDELVAEATLRAMAAQGYFGLSVPAAYEGHELGNLAMILTTEELSLASLAGAGSLITRPEILAKALLAGGSAAQKQAWLPKLAAGDVMVGISVTEPNVGSDVASLACRAVSTVRGGQAGYALTGSKAWCTFAGRADILAVLARTDEDVRKGAKGLSLFIVEKPATRGHAFAHTQPGGGTLEGKADRTPGYRGMHSFSLTFDNWFVPATHLVGEAEGLGRGFALQMAGFSAGRLQTGGRACGVTQAALIQTARYVAGRSQFGQTLASFPLTRFTLGHMAAQLLAARALTYAAAEAMDRDERAASTLAAQAKLFACDVAVAVTQQGQVLHGGWGYAEEYPISRYVVDALVLPIFEGVRPVLTLKVIGRALWQAGSQVLQV